jgi:hypothetical protein
VLKKDVSFLPIESWFFAFFYFYFFSCFSIYFFFIHLQCDRYDLNVKFLIFFKKFYKVHSAEVLSQDRVNKKNSN